MSWLPSLFQSLFTAPAMLLWGLAAAVPIIIHLLSRRKYHEAPWAAMTFLLAAIRKNARRIRVEQFLLLLLRVAIVLLLAAALADPVVSLFPALGGGLGSDQRTHYLLVLDVSYSMDYRTGDKSRLDRAKELAIQVVNDSQQGDGFTLVLLGDPPQAVISDPAFDPRDVVDEIQGLRVRHGGASLPLALTQIEGILQAVGRQQTRLSRTAICFFTDLGRTTWDEAVNPDCRNRVRRLADAHETSLALFDVGQEGTTNLAVNSLELQDAMLTVGRQVNFVAEVQAWGTRERTSQRVQFLVDDQQVRAETLEIGAGDRGTATFAHTFEAPGEHQVEVRLGDDPLAIDNRRWLSVPVQESIQVLCIEGREDEARYLAYALEPQRTATPRVRPTVRLENAILEQDLNRFDCVALCNVRRFTRDEAAVLYDYVRNGGGVLWTLGDLVQVDSYTQQLADQASGRRVLPARLEGLASTGNYSFDPLEYRHPILTPFAGHPQSGLLTTPVWKYLRVRPADSAAARVALAFDTGDPALIEERIGRGRSLLLTTAVSPNSLDRSTDPPTPWTALMTWPSFPPLVQELLAYVLRRRFERRNVLVGEPLDGTLAGGGLGSALTIRTPSGDAERVAVQADGPNWTWSFGGTSLSGVYLASATAAADSEQRFAVNLVTRESDLTRCDPKSLPEQFDPEFHLAKSLGGLPSTRPTQYFRYLLALVLVLVLTETTLAWHFGTAAA